AGAVNDESTKRSAARMKSSAFAGGFSPTNLTQSFNFKRSISSLKLSSSGPPPTISYRQRRFGLIERTPANALSVTLSPFLGTRRQTLTICRGSPADGRAPTNANPLQSTPNL